MRRPELVIFCLCFCLIAMQIVYIAISNDLDILDSRYGQLREKLDKEKKENLLLKEQLYSDESYTTIATKAAALGLTRHSHFIFPYQ